MTDERKCPECERLRGLIWLGAILSVVLGIALAILREVLEDELYRSLTDVHPVVAVVCGVTFLVLVRFLADIRQKGQ